MLTIAWDIDDVLNDLMRAWLHEEWLPAHSECPLRYADITENPPHRALGVSKSAYFESLDSYRLSPKARELRPTPEIMEWLRAYGQLCMHIALTSRPLQSMPSLAEWVFRHFGAYIRVLAVVPVRLGPEAPVYHEGKGGFLQWLGRADVLVDDAQENVEAAGKAGVRGILFPQPWNGNRSTVADTLTLLREVIAQKSEDGVRK
jgi:hypothetical protein